MPDTATGDCKLVTNLNHAVIIALLAWCALGCHSTAERSPQFPTAAHERHVALERQPNLRDLGGYRTADGRSVKWGLLYRSGGLSRLTDADLEKLHARKIA